MEHRCFQEKVILRQTLTIQGQRDGVETKGRPSGQKCVPKGDRWGCTREKRRPRDSLPFYKQKMCMSGFLFKYQKAWEPLHGISHTSNIDNWENTKTKRFCDMHAHSSTIHSSRKVETPKRPSRNEWSSKTQFVYPYTKQWFSHKRSEIMTHATTWVNPDTLC